MSERSPLLERLIAASVHNRALVLLIAALAVVAGIWSLRQTPVDAIPDLSDVQVIVYTEAPGQSPDVVEDQVTYPLSTALLSVPHAQDVRGYSFFGFSMVYVIFEDDTDLYWARARVLESLSVAQGRLPPDTVPELGPDATGVGWVYAYTLQDASPTARALRAQWDGDGDGVVSAQELPQERPELGEATVAAFDKDGQAGLSEAEWLALANFRGVDLQQLRSLQDWYLKYDLTSVDGVAEVASLGGYEKQYQVEVDPEKLRAFGLSLPAISTAIQRANQDVGGRMIEMAETEFMVRGRGSIASIEDLETIPVGLSADSHTPILLRQVARVQIGPEVRRGIAEVDGQGEAVAGIVVMRSGENALDVIAGVKARLQTLQKGLPPGVEIHSAYDRSGLIHDAVGTLQSKLLEEMLVVAVVCLLFLLHFRSALVPILAMPVGVLLAFVAMKGLGVNANIMSLGGIAIAIGVMVDASVVMVENLHKVKESQPALPHTQAVIQACQQVGPALFFSLLIVTLSFLPVFALEQQEGRMFAPLAWTKSLAMGASAVLSITLIPVLMHLLVKGKVRSEQDNPLSRFFIWIYRPVLAAALKRPWMVLILALGLIGSSAVPWKGLGSEFMPPLNEGTLLYMPTTPPGMSVTKARELLQQTDKLIATHPQVDHVFGKAGRAETATDPAPLTMLETTITLTPVETWPEGKTIEDVAAELDALVQFPGLTNAWTMPIKTRIDMLATGIKTPVGVKLMGEDLEVLSAYGAEIEAALSGMEGTASVYSERAVGGNFVDIRVRRQDAARYGLNVADVQSVITSAIGGMNVAYAVEGLARTPISVRFPRELRGDVQAIERVPVPTPMGHTVPLVQVADIQISKGAPAIKSENARRTTWIYVDLEGGDIGGFVDRAQERVAAIPRPPGVSLEWSGQYAYMERANARLRLVVPLTLSLIFILLYLHFRKLGPSALVLAATLLFAPVGGVWLLWALDYNLSVAAGVGFIALLGLAAETGVVMLVYLDQAVARIQGPRTLPALTQAVMSGAVDRVRPKLMTVATTFIGLLPILIGTGTGTRVMKRIAAPMVGGLLSSTLLTLIVLPVLYLLLKRFQQQEEEA